MTKIDDEMVERAVSAYLLADEKLTIEGAMRAGLEAALSPKPEPEIEVTGSMKVAGIHAYDQQLAGDGFCTDPDWISAVYRAMRALEPKAQSGAAYAAKDARQGVSSGAPVKETGGGVVHMHCRDEDNVPYGKPRTHRRKDDPK